jgi:hypothetical protein
MVSIYCYSFLRIRNYREFIDQVNKRKLLNGVPLHGAKRSFVMKY